MNPCGNCPAPVAVKLTCSPSQVPVSITALNRSTAARPSPTASTEDQVRQPGFDKVPALLPRSRSGTSESPHLKGCNPVPTCQSARNIFPRKPLQRWRNRLGGQLASAVDPALRTAYVSQWDFSIQHLGKTGSGELFYLGSTRPSSVLSAARVKFCLQPRRTVEATTYGLDRWQRQRVLGRGDRSQWCRHQQSGPWHGEVLPNRARVEPDCCGVPRRSTPGTMRNSCGLMRGPEPLSAQSHRRARLA
jgi:hypothetical protein